MSMIIDQFYADFKRPPIANNEKKVNVVRPTQRGQQNNGFSNALAKMETRLLNQIRQDLAKTKRKPNKNKNRGGKIDKFPRGGSVRNNNSRSEAGEEFIADVVATSTGFVVLDQYPLNPGQSKTFPRLSNIAKNFEKYQFTMLEFIFKPQVSQYALNGTTGKVLLMCDYDASDAQPSSKRVMEDTMPNMNCMPYEQRTLKLSPKELHQKSDAKYIRVGGLPGSTDIKTYDCGNLFIGTSGIASTSGVLGELHVRYKCILSVPILEQNLTAPVNNSVSQILIPTQTTATTVSKLLTYITPIVINGLQVVIEGTNINLTPGNYMVNVKINIEGSVGFTATSLSLLKNATILDFTAQNDDDPYLRAELSVRTFVSIDQGDFLAVTVVPTYALGTCTIVGKVIINSV